MVATLGDCLATDHARILVEQRLRARRRSGFCIVSPGRWVSNEHGLNASSADLFKFGLGGQVRAGGQNCALRRAAAPRGGQGRARRSARRAVRRRERGDPTASAAAPISATRSGTPTASVRVTTEPALRGGVTPWPDGRRSARYLDEQYIHGNELIGARRSILHALPALREMAPTYARRPASGLLLGGHAA